MAFSNDGVKFFMVVGLVQVLFVVLIAVFGKYPDDPEPLQNSNAYPNFQDVHMMIFFAFACLLAFLKRYAFSAMGFLFFLAVVCVQWTAIVRGFIHHDILGGERFPLGVHQMLLCDFGTATVLISYCVVLGKTSALQLLVMALCEVVVAQLAEYIGFDIFHVSDIGESIFIHMFGAYFGLAVSRVLYMEDVDKSEKEVSVYRSDIVSLIGMLVLWIYWPSFNGGGAGEYQGRAFLNTYMSLSACAVMCYAMSALLSKEGKFEMVHIQNCTLAGGVVVGATANMPLQPYGALISGAMAGVVCVLGFKYLTPLLNSKAKIHDTCGVHNLHGLPAIMAAIVSASLAATSNDWDDREQYDIFPAMAPAHLNATYSWADDRSASAQAAYQVVAMLVALAMAVVSGVVVGLLMKLPVLSGPRGEDLFDDVFSWELPDDEKLTNGKAREYKVSQAEDSM